ncbi:MAG: MoaD/ThiS family protein [Calditrichaeota bacterium]|nr:MAG: MoaD/ThiS family protein [Calditrichota bacterium]
MKLLVFGALTRELQSGERPLETPLDVRTFLDELYEQYPALKAYTFRVAVNHSLAGDDTMIRPEDEVALLPPFAGG